MILAVYVSGRRVHVGLPAVMLCREKQKDAEKEAEATRTADKERARLLRADLEAEDSEDDLEPWRRRPYHTRWFAFLLALLACEHVVGWPNSNDWCA